jgi:Predicted GTPase
MKGLKVLFLLIDLSDSSTFQQTKQVLHELLADQLLKNIPFVVFANKTDLAEPTNKEIIKETFDLNSNPLCETFLSCAVSGAGIRDGMIWLSEKMNSVS